jgi:hypothetical protein
MELALRSYFEATLVGSPFVLEPTPLTTVTIPGSSHWNSRESCSNGVCSSGSLRCTTMRSELSLRLNNRKHCWVGSERSGGRIDYGCYCRESSRPRLHRSRFGNNGSNHLYAADFANGTIDVYDTSFALQPGASFPFVDPTIPTTAGNTYHPYNIDNIGGSLYVTYAKVGTGDFPKTVWATGLFVALTQMVSEI